MIDLDCQDLVELVTLYLDDALDPPTAARFEHHLTLCDGCANYLDQVRTTVRALHRLPEPPLDPVYQDRLLDAFREWRGA